MDMRTAKDVERAVFVAAFAERPKPALRAVDVDEDDSPAGRDVAVYTRSNRGGELVGVIGWQELVSVMAEANGNDFLEGGSTDDSDGGYGVFDTVGGGVDRGAVRLQARRGRLVDQLAAVDEKLANR